MPAETECYGLQSQALGEVTFGAKRLTGNLNYVQNYTGFSGDTKEQNGYFLAFQYDGDDTLQMAVRSTTPVTVDAAPAVNVVFLGADKETAEAAVLHLTGEDNKKLDIPAKFLNFGDVPVTTKRTRAKAKATAKTEE